MERKFRAGDYLFTVGAFYDGTNDFALELPPNAFPNVPHASNWKAAQIINATNPFTLTWDAFQSAGQRDQIQLEILEENRSVSIFKSAGIGSRHAIRGRDTAFIIPAGTLEPGTRYFGVLSFAHHAVIMPDIAPDAVGVSSFMTHVGLPMRTVGARSSGAGTLSFSASRFVVSEHSGTAVITVMRTNGRRGPVSVRFATTSGSAKAGADYKETTGTLAFADGETSKTFSVLILDDGMDEKTETITLRLSNPSGGARLGTREASITIRDSN